jgi:hypothetical protein
VTWQMPSGTAVATFSVTLAGLDELLLAARFGCVFRSVFFAVMALVGCRMTCAFMRSASKELQRKGERMRAAATSVGGGRPANSVRLGVYPSLL